MASDDDEPAERAHIGAGPDLNRAVYERFLSSDYPEALRLAEIVLAGDPDDAVARAVRVHCIDALSRYVAAAPPPPPDESVELLDDEDILPADDEPVSLSDADVIAVDGDTFADTAPFGPPPEPTAPTLSLGSRGEATREVYKLFLSSDYAPALALAEQLLAQGEDDGILDAVARQCRAAITSRSSVPVISGPPDLIAHLVEGDIDARAASVLSRVDGAMSVEEVARIAGMPLDDVLGLLERFVAMGVLTMCAPPVPR
jgi:hypothetical protein